jgi:hypothetical protein
MGTSARMSRESFKANSPRSRYFGSKGKGGEEGVDLTHFRSSMKKGELGQPCQQVNVNLNNAIK